MPSLSSSVGHGFILYCFLDLPDSQEHCCFLLSFKFSHLSNLSVDVLLMCGRLGWKPEVMLLELLMLWELSIVCHALFLLRYFVYMVVCHHPSRRLTRFVESTESKRFHTMVQCVTSFGRIQKVGVIFLVGSFAAGNCLLISITESYLYMLICSCCTSLSIISAFGLSSWSHLFKPSEQIL